jgi:ATP-dependent helicase/nuclease subunit B
MEQQITILWGPARSGKSALALSFYAETLKNRDFGRSLWLTPNQRSAMELRAKLAEKLGHGCLRPGCFTFAQFAETLIAFDDRPMRPIDSLLKRQILQQVIHDALAAGKLQYFAPIADREGLLLWIDALVSDLKRQEVWPDAFLAAANRFGLRPKDAEVAEIYTAYQDLLLQHHCYDAEGRFWAAREALEAGRWGPFADISTVVVDGFTDFTWTQHGILRHLANKAERMWISLQGEDGAERQDLFAKPRTTLEQILKRIPQARVQELNRPMPPLWPAMAHLEQRVFGNPRRQVSAPEPRGIEIWACENQKGELRRIAREIKKLLVEGESIAARGVSKGFLSEETPSLTRRAAKTILPERIGVVFRSVAPLASQVREIFHEYGLPFVIDEGTPLGESPLVVSLLQMLQLIAEDWPYRRVLQTLASNYVTFDDPTHRPDQRGAVEWAVRKLQISEGRKALLNALERRLKYERALVETARNEAAPDLADAEKRLAHWEQAQQVLLLLAKACDVLPKQTTWHDWRGVLQRFAGRLGMLGVAARSTSATGSASEISESNEALTESAAPPRETPDLIAWRQLLAGLNAAERWQQWRGVESAPVTLADLIAELILIGSTQNLAPDNDGLGRVRVISAPLARTGEFEVLFLAGLSEKSFPQLGGEDRLYSGAETQQLNQAGLRFAESHERSSAEMLLFYEVLTRPTRRLVLSYPALDEKAEPLTPSPYVAEVRRAFGEPGIVVADDLQLSPIPPDHQTLWSEREQRIRAVAQAGAGDSAALARVLLPQRGKQTFEQAGLQSGLGSIAERATREEFGRYEGMILGPAAQGALRKSFGPEHCWSTSQLEQYAACPFKFFANRVLRLQDLPEPIFATDHAGRGSWYHGALTWMFRAWAKNPAEWEAMQRDPAAFAERCAEALAAQKPEPALEQALERAIYTIDTAALKNLLSSYLGQAASYAKSAPTGIQAQHFEVAFGPGKTSDRVDPLCQSEPWRLRVNNETFKLSGQIDRIDLGTVGTQLVFGIIDYKTGNQSDFKEADFTGTRLQLPLYALAAEEHLLQPHGAVAWQMGYWSAKHKTVKPYPLAQQDDTAVVPTEDWQKNSELLRQRVWALVNGIRQGQYPMSNPDEHCTSTCEYSTICRVNQTRSLEKTWEPILYQLATKQEAGRSRKAE